MKRLNIKAVKCTDMQNINKSIVGIQVHDKVHETCSSLHTHITETMTVDESL